MTEIDEEIQIEEKTQPFLPLYLIVPHDPSVAVLSAPLRLRVLKSLSDDYQEGILTYAEMERTAILYRNASLTKVRDHRLVPKDAEKRERWDLNHPALAGYFENGKPDTETSH